jgi:diguanylate cyclase (GGDEF)-like protein/PAS domain S-box-containing protein
MNSTSAADIQRRLGDLLDHLPAGVVVHGADGRIVSANRLARELLGQSGPQLEGAEAVAGAWHFIRANGRPMPAGQYPVNVVLRTRQKLTHLIVGVPSGGSQPPRWLICNAYPEFDSHRKLRQVIVCFADCTALKRAKQRLQKSEERLRLVLRGSTDAPWDLDLASGEVYYSERWWSMLGYEPGALPASAELWLELTHPDDKPVVSAFMQSLLHERRDSYSIEFRLRHRDGHEVPVLSRGFVSRDRRGKALRISGTNTDLTERTLAERRIHELAYFDQLTGLPNRRLLVEELDRTLARSRRSGRFGALVFLDLDNFRLLNDTMGHDLGDVLLREVAERLRRTLRHGDQLARPGGDEFVVVLEELGRVAREAVAAAGHVLAKLRRALDEPYYLAGRVVSSTSSMGVVLFDGVMADIEALLRQAELAMYGAKAEGRNTVRFFDPDMQASAGRQAALERALRAGLSTREFVLFCQPRFSCQGALVGAEVLLRWRRGDGSVAGPDEFIGLAEASGLILALGQFVLEESCRALARWRGDRVLAGLTLAVNVSVHQLRDADFPRRVAGILLSTGAPPGNLCLELTESVFAGKVADIVQRMHELCAHGIRFSLDDFGTGYCSLAYLQRLPLAALKIGRSLVHDLPLDPDAVSIAGAIIALARALKLEIVAAGVENEAQRSFLADRGCGALQGYLLGRPVPIGEFERTYGRAGAGHA